MPENQNKAGNKSSKSNTTKSSSGSFFLGLLSIVTLLIAVTGIVFGYYAWLELNKRLNQASVDRQSIAHEVATIDESVKLQNFKKQIQDRVETVDQQIEGLTSKIQQQENIQAQISESTKETLAHINRSQMGWGLKEAEHILRMANHRLQIERDVAGAITALKAADTRLYELNDDRLLPIRESISNQIGTLKNFPYPDWVGISLHLDNVLNGLKRDLIKDAQQQKQNLGQKENSSEQEQNKTGWKKLVDGVKSSISDSVTITREEQKLKLFISQQEKQNAYEFLRLKLLGAKYAVASRDDETYHRELEAAIAWLKNTDSLNKKHDLEEELDELNSVNLEPELPDISEPVILLQETLETIENS